VSVTSDRNLPEPAPQEAALRGAELAAPTPEVDRSAGTVENPPWNGFDVIVLIVVTLLSGFLFLAVAVSLAAMLHVDGVGAGAASRPTIVLLTDVRVLLPAQLATYLVVLFFMVQIVHRRYGQQFLAAIKWNWPAHRWMSFIGVGALLALAVNVLTNYLPETKNLPIDTLLQSRSAAFLMAGFGVFIAPFMEEFFFRGFLYPVLVRRIGMARAVVFTAIAFMAIHVSQLAGSWSPLLVVFTVGIVLTLVRALTRSVAASVLTHMAYNGTLFLMIYFGTQGFRHLDPLTK
jgi:membrane protease YdiL (CAAX protease family)